MRAITWGGRLLWVLAVGVTLSGCAIDRSVGGGANPTPSYESPDH